MKERIVATLLSAQTEVDGFQSLDDVRIDRSNGSGNGDKRRMLLFLFLQASAWSLPNGKYFYGPRTEV